MDSELLELTTGGRLTTDITAAAADFCRGRGDGLLQVFVPHATAGVAIFETGSRSEEDLELILESVLPRGASYLHRHGSPGGVVDGGAVRETRQEQRGGGGGEQGSAG